MLSWCAGEYQRQAFGPAVENRAWFWSQKGQLFESCPNGYCLEEWDLIMAASGNCIVGERFFNPPRKDLATQWGAPV